jgi:CubicO group peptidase (beta-lactamase class C family)
VSNVSSGLLERLPDRLDETGSAALSLAVIRGGEVAEARAWGLADVERVLTATEATLFQAASISKPVSCFAVLRLVERGDLDLDRDVNEYLTTWKVPPVEDWQPRLTLRRLMSHTAGTTVHGFPGYDRAEAVPTVPQILDGRPPANTGPVRVDGVPGSMWRYSGGGTTIVQLVLADSTQTAFPDLLRELVLEPAGMATATFEQPLPESRRAEAATGYHEPGKAVPGSWHVYPEMAAAGLWCTPTDLCRFAIAYQAAFEGRPGALLPQELAHEALRPVPPGTYGLGPSVDAERFGHGGSNEGFLCELTAGRTGGYGCAVMTNSFRSAPLLAEVTGAIAERDTWPNWDPEAAAEMPDPTKLLPRYLGLYRTEDGEEFEVVRRDERTLALVAPGQEPIDLQPLSFTEALVPGLRTAVEFEFPDGAAPGSAATAALVLRQPGAALRAARL